MVHYGKLYPLSFGMAWGLTAGFGWMFLCWSGMHWGFGLELIRVMGSVYVGLSPTWLGGFWGFFWGFVDCFVLGIVVSLIYNCSCKSFCCAERCDTRKK